jgi:hypothetical protein
MDARRRWSGGAGRGGGGVDEDDLRRIWLVRVGEALHVKYSKYLKICRM